MQEGRKRPLSFSFNQGRKEKFPLDASPEFCFKSLRGMNIGARRGSANRIPKRVRK